MKPQATRTGKSVDWRSICVLFALTLSIFNVDYVFKALCWLPRLTGSFSHWVLSIELTIWQAAEMRSGTRQLTNWKARAVNYIGKAGKFQRWSSVELMKVRASLTNRCYKTRVLLQLRVTSARLTQLHSELKQVKPYVTSQHLGGILLVSVFTSNLALS